MDATYDPPDTPLAVLHEDHELIFVDKPSGLLSVPGKGPELADCLIARLQAAFWSSPSSGFVETSKVPSTGLGLVPLTRN